MIFKKYNLQTHFFTPAHCTVKKPHSGTFCSISGPLGTNHRDVREIWWNVSERVYRHHGTRVWISDGLLQTECIKKIIKNFAWNIY